MPPSKKGGKSSASSATRKKQAAKAAKKTGEDPTASAATAAAGGQQIQNDSQRGQKKDKKSKKELQKRKKVFIPPPKPPQPPPDPLDTLGLAALLPPGLVVLLRKAAKKDVITRSRALEGLLTWIEAKDEEGESAALSEEERESALVMMLPSWVHLFPRLAASPTRRLRLMAAQILSKLLAPSLATRSELLLTPQYSEAMLGPWSILAWDTDRATSTTAREAWDKAVSWTTDTEEATSSLYIADCLATLADFLTTLLLQGSTAVAALQPPTDSQLSRGDSYAVTRLDSSRDAKNRDDTNVEEDSKALNARLAAAALGALTWVLSTYKAADECAELINLLHSDALWTAMYSTPHLDSNGSSAEPFGVDYPVTRGRAWSLLATLTSHHPHLLSQLLHIVAQIALEAAWEERDQSVVRNMLDGLLPMLSKHNEAWSIKGEAEEESDEEAEDYEHEPDGDEGGNSTDEQRTIALAGFQRWLSSGCGGSPRQGLPAVLVLVSTMPPSVLPPSGVAFGAFLDFFWSTREAVVYLNDKISQREFSKSFAEVTAYLIGKLSKSSLSAAAELSAEQLGNKLFREEILLTHESDGGAWSAASQTSVLTRSQEAVDERVVFTIRSLAKLGEEGAVVQPVLDILNARLHEVAKGTIGCDPTSINRAVNIIALLASDSSPPWLEQRAKGTALELADASAQSLNIDVEGPDAATLSSRTALLSDLMRSFGSSTISAVVNTFIQIKLPQIVQMMLLPPTVAGSLFAAFLKAAPKEAAKDVLISVVEAAAGIVDPQVKVQMLQALLDGVDSTPMTQSDLGSNTKLDDVVLSIASDISSGTADTDGKSLLSRLIDQPKPFIEPDTVNEVLVVLVSRLHSIAHNVVEGIAGSNSSFQQADQIASILAEWTAKGGRERAQYLVDANLYDATATAAFSLRFLAQRSAPEAAKLWGNLAALPQAETVALTSLREKLADTHVETVIVMEGARKYFASANSVPLSFSLLDILPSKETLEKSFYSICASHGPPLSLSILDPLVATSSGGRSVEATTYDTEGLSSYPRSVYALLLFLEESRSVARSQPWALPHIVMLALLCEDEMNILGGASNLLDTARFSSTPRQAERLRNLLDRCVKVSSSLLAALCGSLPEIWHASTTEALQKSLGEPFDTDPTLEILASLWRAILARQAPCNASHLTRIFSRLLSGILSFTSAGEQEGTKWMRLSQVTESRAPQLSEAIIYSAKSYVYNTPLYDRQRNDIASRLAGVPSTKANEEGLTLLRLAVAIAPPPESSMVYIPQQRVVFLLQGLQRWVASDEDLDEEIDTRLAELFLHVAPLVQEMPGSHLDFFYDLIESNLEVAYSLSEESTLPTLYHTLKLLELLNSLSTSNSLLREVWKEHRESVIGTLQPLFKSLAQSDQRRESSSRSSSVSIAQEMTAELLVGVVRQHQSAFQNDEFHATFCALLDSPMREVQAATFRLLAGSIRSKVKELVLESALEKEGEERPRIALAPPQLLDAVKVRIDMTVEDLEEDMELSRQAMSFLLAWLAIFEHFEEASVQLKSIYSGELQQSGLMASSLLPTIFALVEPRKSRRNKEGQLVGPFDPDRYAVDEIYVDLLEPTDSTSIRQLATHLYFRALLYTPSLVREWWLGIRDRQLSTGVASFTTRHCSPLIATRELSQLREPEALSRLQDEAMSIRILGANEVVGTYTIDEHPMEIGIKIPHDYPLHGVEVRDIRRVGVSEAQWRAWLLGVQQLIVGQNGLVFDALMLFKRNAEAKFAGFEDGECSICYSIISPTDRSLPTKPCKTCSKKFHASCLFKWVTSSGSSTCPLCRSVL